MTDSTPVIVWFRQDLRLTDNPALAAAVRSKKAILPVYVLDDNNAGAWQMGAASRWWLQQSLKSLDQALQAASASSAVTRKRSCRNWFATWALMLSSGTAVMNPGA